jgi:hypothetical protein
MSFLSFTGLIGIFRFLKPSTNRQKQLFLLIFLLPSLLFWGSGVLKEGLILFSLGLCLYHFRKLLENRNEWWRILLIILGLALLRYTKFYLFAFLLPLMAGWVWVHFGKPRFVILKYLATIVLAIGIGSQAYRINPHNSIPELLAKKHNGFVRLAQENHAGSQFDYHYLETSWRAVITASIPGFFNTFFRPFPWDSLNPMNLLSAVENIFILILVLIALIHHRKPEDLGLFYFSLFFFILVYTVSGLITPVSGALVRYKTVALPFLMYLICDGKLFLFIGNRKIIK